MIRCLLVSFWLATLSVSIAHAFTNEAPVSDPVYGPAPYYQDSPRIASDGENFLIAWNDERSFPYTAYAARVNRNGDLLDPTGIRLPFGGYPAAIVFAGDAYVIFWTSSGPSLHATRISRDGEVIEADRVVLQSVPNGPMAAASNGSNILVAWRDRYSVLSADLGIRSHDVVIPGGDPWLQTPPMVTSNGSGFLLAWIYSNAAPALDTWLLDSEGRRLGSINQIAIVGYPGGIASDGNDYLVLYSDAPASSVVARRIPGDGSAIGLPTPIPQLRFGEPNVPIAWDGTSYLIFVRGQASAGSDWPQVVRRLRLDAEGRIVEQPTTVASAFEVGVSSVASNGRDVIFTWRGRKLYEDFDDVYAVKGSGTPDPSSSGTLVSRSASVQGMPSIACSATNCIVARQERSAVYFNRILASGEHLDGTGALISAAFQDGVGDSAPRVIFDGENYVVAWTTANRGLLLARVAPASGQVLDRVSIEGATASSFNIATNGESIIVVWSDGRLHAASLNRALQPLFIRDDLSPKDMAAANPAIAWDGTQWFVAFDQQFFCEICFGGPPPFLIRANVRAVRLSSLLNLLDPDPLAVAVSDSEDNREPRVASTGSGVAIVWTNGPFDKKQVRARYFEHSAFSGGITTVTDGSASSIVWDGAQYAVAYTFNNDVFLTHLGTTDRTAVSVTPDIESAPQLAMTPTSEPIVAYIRIATEPLYGGVARDFVRQASPARTRAVHPR